MGWQIAQQRVKEAERTESYLDIVGNINGPQKPAVWSRSRDKSRFRSRLLMGCENQN